MSEKQEPKHIRHEEKKQKKRFSRSTLFAIILAELVCTVALSCAIFVISWNHIFDNRSDAAVAELRSFDTQPLAASVKPALKAAKERIIKEYNENVWAKQAVNYRTGPATSYNKVGELNQYAQVLRTGTTYNKWSRVTIEGKDYYIKSKYLTTEQPIILDGGQKGVYQAFALSQLKNYGWDDSEIYPLINLWNRESGWNPNSHNRSSGAHGIPQALPASKMAAYGSDYYTNGNTQILWGLNYIATRYGSPSNAWRHFQSSGWY